MDIVQVLTLIGIAIANIGTTITLFLWNANKSDEYRKELNEQLQQHRKDTHDILRSIQNEIKDFHGRLCEIEAKSRGLK